MIYKFDSNMVQSSLIEVAKKVLMAAQTAPKGRGFDTLQYLILTENNIIDLANTMSEIAIREGETFFQRDAENLKKSNVVILMGVENIVRKLTYCSYCGFPSCAEKTRMNHVPCAFSLVDLGIAIGSAVSVLSDYHIDNRVMFSAGKAALEMNLFNSQVHTVFAIPMSVNAKSLYFDRKS